MPVTDEQVVTLRAQLAGDVDEHRRLLARLDPSLAKTGYSTLIAAAFFEAVYSRFGEGGTVGDVIAFVADVRSRAEELADSLDPQAAERIIRAALGDGEIDDLDDGTVIDAQIVLTAALVADARFDETELDEFLGEARKIADEWLRKAD